MLLMLLASCSKGDPYRSEVSVGVLDSLDELQDIEKYQFAGIDASMVDSITSEDVRKLMKDGRIVFIPFDDSSQLESFSKEYGIKLFTIYKNDLILGAILDTTDDPVLIPVNYLIASKGKSEEAAPEVQRTELEGVISEKSALLKLYSGYSVTKSDAYQDARRFVSNADSEESKELENAIMPITEKITLVLKRMDSEETYNADSILAIAHGLILGDDSKTERYQNLLEIASVTPGLDKKVSSYDVATVSLNGNYDVMTGTQLMVSDFSKGIVRKTLYIEDDESIEASYSWGSLQCSYGYDEKSCEKMVTVAKPQKNISYCIASDELISAEESVKASKLNNSIDIVFSNIIIKEGLFNKWVTE